MNRKMLMIVDESDGIVSAMKGRGLREVREWGAVCVCVCVCVCERARARARTSGCVRARTRMWCVPVWWGGEKQIIFWWIF